MMQKAYFFIPLSILLSFSCSKTKSVEGFEIENDFNLEKVASEPLIVDPVDLEFNENGDVIVLEMPGYPYEKKQSRLLVLKDKNNDGVYDSSIVFAENLRLANSFMPYKKGVLVAAPPYLLHLHDKNQNYKIEKIDTLMGGFSTGNLQHNYNALTYGIDNWIYAANGGNDGSPFWWGDSTNKLDLRGQDFRFNLETRKMERLGKSSGGFGLAMDEYGRIFETHNLTHISHLVFPDRYQIGKALLNEHTLENVSNHDENGLARVFPIGEQEERVNHPEQSGYFSGSCGVTYYGGGAFEKKYNNTIWIADVVLNLIHVDKIKSKGASFEAERLVEQKEFLASRDRAFRPVNMSVGPDGAMYVIDIYRKVIEHPEWIPDEIEKTLDMKAGTKQGRIYRITPLKSVETFDFKTLKKLSGQISALSNPNQWVRNTAHRLIMENTIALKTETKLRKLLSSENTFARLHALWILGYSGKLNYEELKSALKDKIPEIRENVLKICETYFSKNELILLESLKLLKDNDQRVRMQAALSISTLEESFPIYKKNTQKIYNAIINAAKLPMDDWNIAALTIVSKSKSAEIFGLLLKQKSINPKLLASLALNANENIEKLEIILKCLSETNLSDKNIEVIIKQLNANTMKLKGSKIEPFIEKIETDASIGLLKEIATLRNKVGLNASTRFIKYSKEATKNVLNSTLPDSIRIQYLGLLDFLPYAQKSSILFECLKNSQPLKLQEGALRQLANYKDVEIGKKVVNIWKDLSPQTRRYASDLLLYKESNHDALLTGLENGAINIGEMNFDLERRRTLLWWTDNENTKRRAKKLFSDSGVTNRQEAINKMKPALRLKGDGKKGKDVFTNTCSACHKYGSIGNEVGPVLTEINRKSKSTILHEILDPNAAVDPKYINHVIETKNGIVHMGIIAVESDKSLTIQKIGGEKVNINKSEIKSFRSTGTSLMMEGFENVLSIQQIADLLDFLQKGN